MQLLIKNGMLINPKTKKNGLYNITIKNGTIQCVTSDPISESGYEAHQVIDAKGYLVFPGFIDLHVHLREPGFEHKETIKTGSRAAAKGGYTTLACMPNTKPALDTVETIKRLYNIIQQDSLIQIIPIGAITENIEGEKLTDHQALIESGVLGLSDDGHTTMNDIFMLKAFEISRLNNIPIITHSEDHHITNQYTDTVYPIEAESNIVQRDISLCQEVDGNLHVAHISGMKSIQAVREAKAKGTKVTCEVTPHHFALNNEMINPLAPLSKVNPPVREKQVQEAIISAIKDGTIDIIATDHAPHEMRSKETSYEKASYGISGIETAWQIAYTKLHKEEGVSLMTIIDMMTAKPAQIGRLEKVGSIEEGYDANITIVNPDEKTIIDPSTFVSKGNNTPFGGYEVESQVVYTIYKGRKVYDIGGQ